MRKTFIIRHWLSVIIDERKRGVRAVQIYLEYALVENFCVDTALLYLSLVAARQPIVIWRLCLAGAVGAVFAVLFPLLVLPTPLSYLWKFLMGALLCLIAIKKQNGRGRSLLTVGLFYAFSFCFAGGLIAVFELFSLDYSLAEGGGVITQIPVGVFLLATIVFFALCRLGVARLYRKRKQYASIYACKLHANGRVLRLDGLCDTGNTACYLGCPVCFLSVEQAYELYGLRPADGELTIATMAGEKRIPLYRADGLTIAATGGEVGIDGVYVSPSTKLTGRAYKLLFPSFAIEEKRR